MFLHSRNQSIQSDHHIITNINLTNIKNRQIIIARKVIADKDLLAIITVKPELFTVMNCC